MPELSGTDFLREAKQLCPDVPALIVTGYAEAEAIGDRPAGVTILQKPYTPTALESAIAKLCGDHLPAKQPKQRKPRLQPSVTE